LAALVGGLVIFRTAFGIADRVWSIGELLDAALPAQPIDPVVTAPDRRRALRSD
jgi:hypothetical protein